MMSWSKIVYGVKSSTFVLLNLDLSLFENNVEPDQLASDEAIWSGSTQILSLLKNTGLQLECYRQKDKNLWGV